jgi:hypothetical protein
MGLRQKPGLPEGRIQAAAVERSGNSVVFVSLTLHILPLAGVTSTWPRSASSVLIKQAARSAGELLFCSGADLYVNSVGKTSPPNKLTPS